MKSLGLHLILLGSLTLLPACQGKPMSQVYVQQVWEYGKPIDDFSGYTKGVYFQTFKQFVFFDKGIYRCRSTTLVAQGFSRDLTTNQSQGTWKPDATGVPRLEQHDGSYLAISEIYPPADQPFYLPHLHELKQTYPAPFPKPFPVFDHREMIDLLEMPEEPVKPVPESSEPTSPLPISPYRP